MKNKYIISKITEADKIIEIDIFKTENKFKIN